MIPIQPDKPYLLIDPDTTTQVVTTVEPHDKEYCNARVKKTNQWIPIYRKNSSRGAVWRLKETVDYEIIIEGSTVVVQMAFALDRFLIPLEDDNLKKESSADKPVEKPKEEVVLV